MGRSLSPILRRELGNLDKDADSRRSAMKALKSYVKELDSKGRARFTVGDSSGALDFYMEQRAFLFFFRSKPFFLSLSASFSHLSSAAPKLPDRHLHLRSSSELAASAFYHSKIPIPFCFLRFLVEQA